MFKLHMQASPPCTLYNTLNRHRPTVGLDDNDGVLLTGFKTGLTGFNTGLIGFTALPLGLMTTMAYFLSSTWFMSVGRSSSSSDPALLSTSEQGLSLVHSSARRNHVLWRYDAWFR